MWKLAVSCKLFKKKKTFVNFVKKKKKDQLYVEENVISIIFTINEWKVSLHDRLVAHGSLTQWILPTEQADN